jgi:uncharacterized protein
MQKSFIINNLEFAQNHLKLTESFDVGLLVRLSETLCLLDKTLVYFELIGTGKQFRQPSLQLHIKADLPVICQRCLNQMTVNVALNYHYLVCDAANDTPSDDDEIDWLEINHEMNLLDLIEDELLLAMPIAPTHNEACSKTSMQSGEKPNPFAVLKGIIK